MAKEALSENSKSAAVKPKDTTHPDLHEKGKLNVDTDLTSIINSKLVKSALTVSLGAAFPTAIGLLGKVERAVVGGDRAKPHGADSAAGKAEGPVKHDAQGRVTEVDYPNGSKRTFGYDEKGQLSRMTQPTGEIYVRKANESGTGVHWEVEKAPQALNKAQNNFEGNKGVAAVQKPSPEKGADKTKAVDAKPVSVETKPVENTKQPAGIAGLGVFHQPKLFDVKVAADGTVSYRSEDGSNVTTRADNSRTTSREGFITNTNGDGRVTDVRYTNGDKSSFGYDQKGEMINYSVNDKNYRVINKQIYDSEGNDTGQRNPNVSPWGSLMTFDKAGNFTQSTPDGGKLINNLDGSSVTKNPAGQITKVISSDRSSRTFTYDEHGHLDGLTDSDGKAYDFDASVDFAGIRWGEFKAADGSKLENVTLDEKGVLRYQQDGKMVESYPGAFTSKTTLSAKELMGKAVELNNSNWIGGTNSQISKTLEGMNDTDRVALDKEYKRMFGETLTDKLKGQMWNPIKEDATSKALNLLADANLRHEIKEQFSSERDHEQMEKAQKLLREFDERAQKEGLSQQEIAEGKEKAAKSLEGAENRERVSVFDKALTDAAPTLESLRRKYGVQAEEAKNADGSKITRLSVDIGDGQKQEIVSSKSDNPRDIERQLRKWQDDKLKELEREYPIKISRDGQSEKIFDYTPSKSILGRLAENVMDATGIKDAPDNPFGENVQMKTPRVDELVGLEMALKRSAASVRTEDDRGTKVLFPTEDTREKAAAYYSSRHGEKDVVVFDPSSEGAVYTRGVALHEWFHNSQAVASAEDNQSINKFYADLGFRNQQGQWQIRGRDGKYYAQAPDQDVSGQWTRVDDQGRPLKADGSLAASWLDNGADRHTNSEMRNMAAVRPASDYFPSPIEGSADAIRSLRDSQKSRQDLLEADCSTYMSAKIYDQRELDRSSRFGKNPDGTSKYIRLPDSSIALNTASNRKLVADFEKSVPVTVAGIGIGTGTGTGAGAGAGEKGPREKPPGDKPQSS